MIISHKYKYVFLELPRTGTTSISEVLCEKYDGKKIHYRHAPYEVFLRRASEEEKKYFLFSGVRNPLDRAHSLYYKMKVDHRTYFTRIQKRGNLSLSEKHFLSRYRFVQETNASFEDYFNKYFRIPYDDWGSLCYNRLDAVIRFENLQSDYEKVMKELNIDNVDPLPESNKVNNKQSYWESYTPSVRKKAGRIFGVYMKKMEYDFPDNWNITAPNLLDQLIYNFFHFFWRLFWSISSLNTIFPETPKY